MSLRYSLKNAKDLFNKLKRDINLLEDEVNSDRFFNIVITAFHIYDWIKNDDSFSEVIKNDLKSIFRNKIFLICRDIANSSKHFKLNYTPNTISADSQQGFGKGRYGKGKYGKGEESITIKYSDDFEINALDFSHNILSLWNSFFSKHNI